MRQLLWNGKIIGGQKQRLSIARAMLSPIIFLMRFHLDAEHTNIIKELTKNKTTIAHRLTILSANKIYVIDNGFVLEMEIMKNYLQFKKYKNFYENS